MEKLIFAISTCVALLISACTTEDKTISTGETITVETKVIPKIDYASSIVIDKSDVILYPLYLNSEEYASYKSRSGDTNYWNLIFYNAFKNEVKALAKKNNLMFSVWLKPIFNF